jgi:hypothetical protein
MKYGKDVFSGRTVSDNWTCKAAPPGNNSAAIQLTFIPSLGDRNFLEGHASYVNPANYYVVVYVHDGWIGWWIKPYARLPRTFINCNARGPRISLRGKKTLLRIRSPHFSFHRLTIPLFSRARVSFQRNSIIML